MKNKLNILFFIFFVLISFCSVIYFLRYDILTEHDLGYFGYGNFLYPEHGRYFATYFTYLLTDKIPSLFHIHVNDFQALIVAPVKALCIVIICLTLTFSAFIFSKSKKMIFNNFSFSLMYLVIFLLLFNCFYFFDHRQFELYFNCKENAVFFEYIMAMFYYILFSACFIYFFVTKEPINKLKYYLFLIITFILGVTLEITNIPIFMFLTCFMFYNIYSFIKTKKSNGQFWGIYITYCLSMICYYIRPNDHELNYGGKTLAEYFHTEFMSFLHNYVSDFLLHNSLLIICTLIILILILFFIKEHKEQNKRFIFIILLNIFILLGFYFMTFIIGHNDDSGIYYIDIAKWMNVYKVICLFYFLISLGYFTDNLSEKYSKNIRISLCILALIIFHKPLLTDYYANFNKNVNVSFDLKTCAYMCEKISRNSQETELTVHLPKKYKYLEGNTYFNKCYIENIIKSDKKLKEILYDDNINMNQFSEKELTELKFKNIK